MVLANQIDDGCALHNTPSFDWLLLNPAWKYAAQRRSDPWGNYGYFFYNTYDPGVRSEFLMRLNRRAVTVVVTPVVDDFEFAGKLGVFVVSTGGHIVTAQQAQRR